VEDLTMLRFAMLGTVVCCFLVGQQPAHGQESKREIELLKKENELLKRENELLKKEIELLKRETAGKGGDKKGAAKNDDLKTTVNGVDYEVTSSKRVGRAWLLTVSATSSGRVKLDTPLGKFVVDKKVFFKDFRGITPEGATFLQRQVMVNAVPLPTGVKIQLKLRMNNLPANVTKLARVELWETNAPEPVVFVNVPVER
jgi:hypothetical protein